MNRKLHFISWCACSSIPKNNCVRAALILEQWFCLLLTCGETRTEGEKDMLKLGVKAPDFSVADAQGQVHTRDAYVGRSVVLWFYPKSDTPG